MKKLAHLSLKAKTIVALGVILLLVIGLFYITNKSLNFMQVGYSTLMDQNYENINHLKDIQISMLTLRRHEKDFLLRSDEKYIKKHDDEFTLIKTHALKLRKYTNGKDLKKIDDLEANYTAYKMGFNKIVKFFKKEGNSKSGIRGELRSIAHSLEKQIKSYNLPAYYNIELLTFRRREKDYLLRRDATYLAKLDKDIKRVETRMRDRGMPQDRNIVLTKLIKQYRDRFNQLVLNYDLITKQKSDFRKNIHALEEDVKILIEHNQEKLSKTRKEIESQASKTIQIFILITVLILLLIVVINILAYRITTNISKTVSAMKKMAQDFLETSGLINESSISLNELATTQASAIQQTASSVNEITAMVSKSTDSAVNSQAKSQENAKAANDGKKTVHNVIKAMNSLSDSTNDMTNRFNETGKELQDVVNIINQIGEKARVINDIVFQTKLLSFNASVEAARAGEHGKGFAVVAEEIGNLASMSGTSAEEISTILEASVTKVNDLVKNNKSQVESLVNTNTQKVNHGVETAKECEVALNTIINNIDNINASISDIAQASQEQDTGVKEISQAINEFNSNNQKTVSLANSSKNHSDSIKEKANSVFEMSSTLEVLMNGK